MAKANGRTRCATCGKEKAIFKCGGCSQDFCYNHSTDHRQELSKQLDEIEVTRDLFRQTLAEQTVEPQKHPLIQQIDTWERDSMKKIRRTAEEARQLLLKHTGTHIGQIEVQLDELTDQLRQSRRENDFVETDLQRWGQELSQLKNLLVNPSNIAIREDATSLVNKITIDVPTILCMPSIDANASWVQKGITIAGDGRTGDGFGQLCIPMGMNVDENQTLYIADWGNHRVIEWKDGAISGQVVAGGNEQGERTNQFNNPTDVVIDKRRDCLIICDKWNQRVVQWPRQNGTAGQTIISNTCCYGLAIDNNGCLYVSDYEKHEVRRWRIGDTSGTVIAGGNGKGDRLDQLNYPTFIFVDRDNSVYVSDRENYRVMKWMKGAKEGIVVAGGQRQGNDLDQLSNPHDIIADDFGTVYVVDSSNHRVMRWVKGAKQGSIVVGGKGYGKQANQLERPTGLSFDRQGNLYVVDSNNHRVQKFNINSSSNS